jgi:signal transduction histidine kinase
VATPSGGTLRISPVGATFEPSHLEPILLLLGEGLLVSLLLIPLSRRITRPLRDLAEVARAIAKGDLSRRAAVRTKDEIGELGRAFNYMADQIAASLRQEKDLVAGVSHELRAPLSRVRMAGELLAETADLPPEARKHLRAISEEVDELDSLIEELLTRAKLESAGFELEREPCDLGPIVRQAVTRADGFAEGRVEVAVPEEGVRVSGSPTLLSRALRNVVENALQYSPPESRVEVAVTRAPAEAWVTVRDRGIGIPPEEVGRIFDPFFRGERSRSRRTGGVGFGLTLARQIVLRHGGDIAVESTAGAGTRVTLKIPLSPA